MTVVTQFDPPGDDARARALPRRAYRRSEQDLTWICFFESGKVRAPPHQQARVVRNLVHHPAGRVITDPQVPHPSYDTQLGVMFPDFHAERRSGDTAASPWMSDWSAAPRIPAAAPPYADRAASNPYLGSAADAGELDPARTRRPLAEAKRAHDFAGWISGGPGVRSALPMGYVAAATDAPRPSTPSAGSDDQFDGAVGTQPPQDQLGPASNGLFVQSSGWPFPPASMDAALPPVVVAASDQAPPSIRDPNGGATIPYPGPDSMFWPGSPSAMKAGRNFIRNVQDLIDAWTKWFNVTDAEKEACYKQFEHDESSAMTTTATIRMP